MEITNFTSYKDFLNSILLKSGEKRGLRSSLALYLNCQTGFISQVLNGSTHFSLEHCLAITRFLNLTVEESHFFMLLVQADRSGSKELEKYFRDQIEIIRIEKNDIKKRIKVENKLNERDHLIYYGNWYYSAIHILSSIPAYDKVLSNFLCKFISHS